MPLTAHVGYGFKIKMQDIRNTDIFKLLSPEKLENWLDDTEFDVFADDEDRFDTITKEIFTYMRPWDYIELIDEAAKNGYAGIFASLPGYAEADHDEVCIVVKDTYFSAYGNSEMLDPTVLADADKDLIKEFSKKYFNDTPVGWVFWPYSG
jgi:hypothetical protein